MVLVIDKVYSKKKYGTLSFYLNRILRIYPLYIFYLLGTFLLLKIFGNIGFLIEPPHEYYLFNANILSYTDLSFLLKSLLSGNYLEFRCLITAGSPDYIPQAWSLGVEILFYIIAPLLCFRKRLLMILLIISVAYNTFAIMMGLDFDNYLYKSFLGSSYMFAIGGLIYLYKDRLPNVRKPGLIVFISICLYLFSLYLFRGDLEIYCFYIVAVLQVFIVYFLSKLLFKKTSFFNRLDKAFGNLSYGIFISHFFVCYFVLAILDKYMNNIGYLGRYNRLEFGIWITVFTIIFTVFIYLLIEHPIEHLRDKVRLSNKK